MPLAIGLNLFAERSQLPVVKWLQYLLPLVFAAAYYNWLAPEDITSSFRPFLFFVLLQVVFHLWVTVSPYVGQREPLGFWRFNHALFSRILLAAVFTFTLTSGLCLAIVACDTLFGMRLEGKTYGRVWISVLGIFNTWFFFAGVPKTFDELNLPAPFPKSLKVFSQYILIPLVLLYMAILYLYSVKIVAEWNLPQGWVASLIFGYEVLGILAILLVHPLAEDKDASWLRKFSRFFFIASLPLIGLLYLAVGVRIRHYGITEYRYYGLVLGVWIGFVSTYFLFSKQKNIKLIPASLIVLGLLTVMGPWGVFPASDASQRARLRHLLVAAGGMKQGSKLLVPLDVADKRRKREIKGIITYFVDRRQADYLQALLSVDLNKLDEKRKLDTAARDGRWEQQEELRWALYKQMVVTGQDEKWGDDLLDFYVDGSETTVGVSLQLSSARVPIAGYAQLHEVFFNDQHLPKSDTVYPQLRCALGDTEFVLRQRSNGTMLLVYSKNQPIDSADATRFLNDVKKGNAEDGSVNDVDRMSLIGTHSKFVVRNAYVRVLVDSSHRKIISSIDGWMLIK
jgi:hypothetical protein